MVLESASSSVPPGGDKNGWLGSKPSPAAAAAEAPVDNTQTTRIPATRGSADTDIAGKDDLANTTLPKSPADPARAQAQVAYMREMANNARAFYEADKELDKEDRVKLFKAYRYQTFGQYGGALLGLAIGLVAPKYVCRYLGRPYKASYSSLTSLVTVLTGYNVAGKTALQHNLSAYEGNRNYTTIINSMKDFPPYFGYGYYQETSRHPDSAFPDPALFDWSKYPAFPLVLAFYSRYKVDIKGISAANPGRQAPGAAQGIPSAMTPTTPHTTYSQDSNLDDGTRMQSSGNSFYSDSAAHQDHQPQTGSAWDRIRAQNQGSFEWEPQQVPHQAPPQPEKASSDDPFDLGSDPKDKIN